MNIEKELQNAIETANKANEAVLELKKKYEESLKPKEPKVWKPKHGDTVWWPIPSEGVPMAYIYNGKRDEFAYEFGLLFPTKESCQKWIDKTLATQRIKNKILELNDGWEPDWTIMCMNKWYVAYSYKYPKFYCDAVGSQNCSSVLPFIKSRDDAQWIIDNMQDDLKIVFDVEGK